MRDCRCDGRRLVLDDVEYDVRAGARFERGVLVER